MSFPQTALSVSAQLDIGGTWTDVALAGDVRADGVTGVDITRGITSSGGSIADRGSCALTLDNRTGKYSSRNPRSPYYGKLGRNTGLRVGVAYGTPWLDIPYGTSVAATAPDSVALSVTGDLDVRVDAALAVWGDGQGSPAGDVVLAGKTNAASGQSWSLAFTSAGQIQFGWSANGSITTYAYSDVVHAAPWQRMAVRVTLDVNDGAGGHIVTFYTSTTAGTAGPWTQVSSSTVAGTTSIFDSATQVSIGSISALGYGTLARRIYAAQIRTGIGGTVVANPDFTAQAVGATSFTDSAGVVWTVPSGGISNTYRRFTGVAASWPPQWTTGGKDAITPISGAGRLRQIGQRQKALQSTMRRYLAAQPTIIGYWPMEDAVGSTQAASALAGGAAMTVSGLTFGQDSSLPGSDALPQTGASASWWAPVTGATTGQLRVECVFFIPQSSLTESTPIMQIRTSGTYRTWTISITTSGTALLSLDPEDGGAIATRSYATPPASMLQSWQRMSITAQQNGTGVDITLGFLDDVAQVGWDSATNVSSMTLGAPIRVSNSYDSTVQGTTVGHVAVWSDYDTTRATTFVSEPAAYAGETAAARLTRACSESSLPLSIAGLDAETVLVGAQPHGTLLDVVQDAVGADEAMLCEPLEFDGFRVRTRASLYNQTSALDLNYQTGPLVIPLGPPTDDDQRILNDSTVTRTGGSSGRYVLETGTLSTADVGLYDEEITRNLYTDDQAVQSAGWRVHLGTWDEARYPAVTIYLEKTPSLIPQVCAIDTGSRIRITGTLPTFLPPGPLDLLVLGYEEQFAQFSWHVTFACIPYGPYQVGVVSDATLGRADTDGSTLTAGITATATSMQVTTPSGLWTTTDTPFDVLVAGEQITVGTVSGASSPQTFSSLTRSVNGISKTQTAGTAVALATGSIVAL